MTWLVTGASSGLGRALAETLLGRGHRVIGTSRDTTRLAWLSEAFPDTFVAEPLELSDVTSVSECVERAFARFKRIDVVVANAGYGLFGAAEEITYEQLRTQIEVNLIGTMQMIRAALPGLRAQGGGHIVVVTSEGGITAYPGFSVYHAAKWGLEGFSESLASEVSVFGINVTIVEPGPTVSNFATAMIEATPMREYGSTPVGTMRQDPYLRGAKPVKGDPVRSAEVLIDSVTGGEPPLRLMLGSVAYKRARRALVGRLAVLDAHKGNAYAADSGDLSNLGDPVST